MEFMAGFFVGLVWWEIGGLFIMLILLVVSEVYEHIWGFLVAIAVLYFYPWNGVSLFSSTDLGGLFLILFLFFIVGIFWSMFKTKRTSKKIAIMITKSFEADGKSDLDELKKEIRREVSRKLKTDKYIYWVLNWPFSVIHHFFGEFIYEFVSKIIVYLTTVYDRIIEDNINRHAHLSKSSED